MAELTAASFYLVAHQDDWQFFRGEYGYADLSNPAAKVVFVYLTAGDAGRTDGWWKRREAGAVASVIAATPALLGSEGTVDVNGHVIRKVVYNKGVSYFLRLPDGNLNGRGYAVTGNQSLARLRSNEITRMWAVDLSTAYEGWTDLCETVRAIVEAERLPSQPHPWVNSPDFDTALNPGDHSDHYAAAGIANTFVPGSYNWALWVGYDIKNRLPNLTGERLHRKRAVYQAYGVAAGGPVESEWNNWGPRSYFRRILAT
jgi:hypothetical protein